MKRNYKIYISLSLILLLSFWGCSIPSHLKETVVDEVRETENMARKIVGALDIGDRGALQRVLSIKSLEEATDLTFGLDYILKIYQGPSIEVTSHGSHYGQTNDPSGSAVRGFGSFDIRTATETFVLTFEYFILDTRDRSNEGVYRLRLETEQSATESANRFSEQLSREYEEFKESGVYKDYSKWNYGASYERPGIYWPGWDEE